MHSALFAPHPGFCGVQGTGTGMGRAKDSVKLSEWSAGLVLVRRQGVVRLAFLPGQTGLRGNRQLSDRSGGTYLRMRSDFCF